MENKNKKAKKGTPAKVSIGHIAFTCYETNQLCVMHVDLIGDKIRLNPAFDPPLNDDTRMTVTLELWNRWTAELKKTLGSIKVLNVNEK